MKQLITILFLAVLSGCNSSKEKKHSVPDELPIAEEPVTIEDRVLYPKTTLSALFDNLRPSTQTFRVNGNKDTLIVGQNGTTLSILKNTFVNAQGQAAGTISIDLVEVNSIADMIRTNLQTTSGDAILQTGGMFFIDAKEDDKSLAIAAGKSIYVEVKSDYKDPKMKTFDGKFNEKGQIDWKQSGNLENNLIALPLSLLDFNKAVSECWFSKKQLRDLSHPKFENTYIATREFEDRCSAMNVTTCDWYYGLDQKLLDIYTHNIDKPLFYSDSLVVDYLEKNYRDKIDNAKKFDWDAVGWTTYLFKSFTALRNQHLTNTINFGTIGITENTTVEELVSKGYAASEAEKFIALFRMRTQIINSRKAEKQSSQLASYSFSINKLGWVNVDRFIDEKNTQESTFSVAVKAKDAFDYISVSLIIPDYNVAVFSVQNEGDIYSFTKKGGGYRKLPVGQNAVVVAFSYKDDKPYFGMQKIKIPKDGRIDLPFAASTVQEIKKLLAKLKE